MLLAHAVLLAVGPAPVYFLANHDHAVIGSVTAEQWRLHVQFHLRQVDGHYRLPDASSSLNTPDRPRITSLAGCAYDMLSASARSLPATSMIHLPRADDREVQTSRVDLPLVIDRSPDFAPIRPPPEAATG